MSHENAELAQAALDAWNVRDMDAFRELLDPDVVLRNPEGWPEPGPFVGREAVMRQYEQAREIWDTDAMERVGDLIEAADRVVFRSLWRGASHGVESCLEFTIVFTVRQRRISGVDYFWDHADGLEAARLRG